MVRTRFLLENVISDGDLNTGHLMSFNHLSVFENYGQILDEKFMVLIAIPPWKKR